MVKSLDSSNGGGDIISTCFCVGYSLFFQCSRNIGSSLYGRDLTIGVLLMEAVEGSKSVTFFQCFPLDKAVKRIEDLSLSDLAICDSVCVSFVDDTSKGSRAWGGSLNFCCRRSLAADGGIIREVSICASTVSGSGCILGKVECSGAKSEESSSEEFHFDWGVVLLFLIINLFQKSLPFICRDLGPVKIFDHFWILCLFWRSLIESLAGFWSLF